MWHELAHVFTLQLSNQRVPRWVTEGISVYEEGLVDPAWARDSELAFARAYGEGRVLKLADLNAGIARARRSRWPTSSRRSWSGSSWSGMARRRFA